MYHEVHLGDDGFLWVEVVEFMVVGPNTLTQVSQQILSDDWCKQEVHDPHHCEEAFPLCIPWWYQVAYHQW